MKISAVTSPKSHSWATLDFSHLWSSSVQPFCPLSQAKYVTWTLHTRIGPLHPDPDCTALLVPGSRLRGPCTISTWPHATTMCTRSSMQGHSLPGSPQTNREARSSPAGQMTRHWEAGSGPQAGSRVPLL